MKEWNDQIIFLRKVIPGAADKSYGIQVAKLAGIPLSVIRRAREVLETLDRKEQAVVEETERGIETPVRQLSLFEPREHDVLRVLRGAKIETMSPIDALNLIDQLKKQLNGVN